MSEKRTSLFENGLIWFGAGVSIAEILTGTYLASLGMKKGLAAILLGHLIGCVLLFLAGVIGGKVRKSAMETVKISFGQKGSLFFALLNVIQLVGWTAIMIYDGALAAIVYPMDNITDFLYLIGSVFAPMIAIQIGDFFLLKKDHSEREIQISNMILWVIGFVLYRMLMKVDLPVGNTLPDMVITMVLCLIWGKIAGNKNK